MPPLLGPPPLLVGLLLAACEMAVYSAPVAKLSRHRAPASTGALEDVWTAIAHVSRGEAGDGVSSPLVGKATGQGAVVAPALDVKIIALKF